MKTSFLFALLLAASAPAFAQQDVYHSVSRMPTFAGDAEQAVAQNLQYTPRAVVGDLKASSVVRFTVSPTGEISGATTERSCGDLAMDSLARRAVLAMPPWKPGRLETGEAVAVSTKLIVRTRPAAGAKVDAAVVAWADKEARLEADFRKNQEDQRIAAARSEDSSLAAAARANEAEYRAQCIKDFGPKIGNRVANGEVWLGMSKAQAEMAWGTPSRTNASLVKGKRADVWYYTDSDRWLAFADGKLISITK